jgi:hypothetical protein
MEIVVIMKMNWREFVGRKYIITIRKLDRNIGIADLWIILKFCFSNDH